LALVAIGVFRIFFSGGPEYTIPRLSGDALVVGSPETPAVIVLASHWETVWKSGGGRHTLVRGGGILHWDVFAYDVNTLQRRFVSRIASIRNGGRESRESILGAEGSVIWVLADRLVGISEKDGTIVADVASLEEKEPRLKGMIANDPGRFAFDKGLIVTASDARRWRIAGPGATITEVQAGAVTPEPTQTVWLPNGDMPPYQSLKKRSVVIDGVWYGLGYAEEREKFATPAEWNQDFREPRRYKLWSGPAARRQEFKETASSRDYLQSGLLIQETKGPDRVIGIAKPYRLLVLHQDRVDRRAKQTLTCVNLDGAECWSAALSVSTVRNVLPVGQSEDQFAAILFAVDYAVDEKGEFVDGGRDANDALIRVSMKDGSLRRVDFGTMDMDEVKKNAIRATSK
jgi:hypothetical protein